MPYLYTLFQRAHALGEPILRPLCYEFEDDPRTFADGDDFMFGPHLLVANVLEPSVRERRVYLPRHEEGWYDFHTGEAFAGGQEIVVPAPLDRIPLFARAGAIVPLTAREDFTRLHDEPSRQVRVFPPRREAHAAFVLYEDDGIGLGYRSGDSAEVAFTMATGAQEIQIVARKTGRYALPYRGIGVVLPANEQRKLSLLGDGVDLTPGS
jgi:alpha-glucosidase